MSRETLQALEREIHEKARELHRLRRERPRQPVEDHVLTGRGGEEVRLSDLFDGRADLLLIHNMGRRCPYCTLWADSLEGVRRHLEDRAALALVSPDPPDEQAAFAAERGWGLRTASDPDHAFTRAMGFWSEEPGEEGPWPGFSTFHRRADGSIERVASAFFGPGDLYLGLWHLLENLADGVDGWHPRLSYEGR